MVFVSETKFGVIRGSFPELPDACTDVIYGRSFAYTLMKESYALKITLQLTTLSEDNYCFIPSHERKL